MVQLPTVSGRREALYVALAAAEVCWVTPLFLALIRFSDPHPPLLAWLGILVLMLGFFYLYRALDQANLSLRLQQGLLLAALLLSLGLFLRLHVYAGADLPGLQWLLEPFRRFADLSNLLSAELVLFFILIYLWARGIHLARRSITVVSVGFSFRVGVLIWMWLGPAVAFLGKQDVSAFVVAYFFFSLMAVALSRVEEISQMPGSGRIAFSGFWLGSTVGAVTFLVILGSLVAVFFYGGGLRQVLGWFAPVLIVLQVILVLLAWLIFGLLQFLFSWLKMDWSAISAQLQEMLEGFVDVGRPFAGIPVEITEPARRVLEIAQASIIVAIIAISIFLVLLFTWWRGRRSRRRIGDEERESLLSGRALARNLLATLQAGRDRLSELAGLVDQYGLRAQLLSAISIRRIYANLVRLATRAGYPRTRSQTPFEYLETLYEALPGNETDAKSITDAYVNAHYGQVPDNREELQQLRECWDRIRARGVQKKPKKESG